MRCSRPVVINDTTEMWREVRRSSQASRAKRRDQAIVALVGADVAFTRHNQDAHLVVTVRHDFVIDFWPGPGHWRARQRADRGRHFGQLLALLKRERSLPDTANGPRHCAPDADASPDDGRPIRPR